MIGLGMRMAAAGAIVLCAAGVQASDKSSDVLLHYWSFNDANFLVPTQTIGGGAIAVTPGPDTEVTTGTGQDFFNENGRLGELTGAHLRVNDPLGAQIDIAIPTTGYEEVVVMYETRRSNQGAGSQILEYTLNGTDHITLTTIGVISDTPVLHTFDFSSVAAANDNANFGLRITFAVGGGGVSGNNRFDNLSVEAAPLADTNVPPVVVAPVAQQYLVAGGSSATIDLEPVFEDDDPLTYSAISDKPFVASVSVSGSDLTIVPQSRGDAVITIEADDGQAPPVQSTFRVLVYPDAHALADGDFFFGSWGPNEPEHVFPEHMIFLQSDTDDPDLAYPLDFAYFITVGEYAAGDAATIGFPYNNTARTRLNGLNADGISLINTGRGRDLGGVLVALNTVGVENISASWLAGTILANSRKYNMRVQYRIGHTGPFQDLIVGGNPWEYVHQGDGHVQAFDPAALPLALENQPYVQLLWKHHFVEGDSGPRTMIRLDDISITADVAEFRLNASGQTTFNRQVGGTVTFAVSAANADGTVTYQWFFGTPATKSALAIPGAESSTLTLNDLSLADAGTYFCEATDDFETVVSPLFTLNVVSNLPAGNAFGLAIIAMLLISVGTLTLQRRART